LPLRELAAAHGSPRSYHQRRKSTQLDQRPPR
jgi:hypothetical protein